jgi:hypothetical protein
MAMRFDLNTNAGEWFPFFSSEVKPDGEVTYLDPEEGAGRVCLRIADEEVTEKIRLQTRKPTKEFVYNPKTRAMERWEGFDQTPTQAKKEREMIWDHAIVAWEDILDGNGNPIPCTLENKMRLMSNPQFIRFVGRCLQLISGASAEADKAAEKN